MALYKQRPEAACEASLALLISWPKAEIIKTEQNYGYEADHYGFTFEADHMYPPFWTKGNFLMFLREHWLPAVELIISLVNFATDRYENLHGLSSVTIPTPEKQVAWKGNNQVYTWSRFEWNTAKVITCALMALEKWMEEQIQAEKPITDAVRMVYNQGNSFAFAGLLVSVGKRHPKLFAGVLKPLLFARELYYHDIGAVHEYFGGGYWPADGKVINQLRQEWNQLPGRKTHLKDVCIRCLLENPDLAEPLNEVSNAWREEAEELPAGSEERLIALRWAADFNRSFWKEVSLPDGREGWRCERPPELQDPKGEERIGRIQHLMMLPHQCSDLLERGQPANDSQLENIWQQLQDWTPFERLGVIEGEREDAAEFRDHRHARAGLIAVLLCTGESWLSKHLGRREWLQNEVLKILADPPAVTYYGPDDVHDDFESLMARAIVRCWANTPQDPHWRGRVGSFVTAYRYRTVQRLFQEAFNVRERLGDAYRELEGLTLAFASARWKATQSQFLGTRKKTDAEALKKWGDKWLPKFARGKGPKWMENWSKVEIIESFQHECRSKTPGIQGRDEIYRRNYGLDMGIMLAAFGQLPALVDARDSKERSHWLGVCSEFSAAFCRTLPNAARNSCGDAEWHYDHWREDERIFEIVAQRLFECTPAERKAIMSPIIQLPFAAHHHICYFLGRLLIEPLRTEPYRIAELIPIWREIADIAFTPNLSPTARKRDQLEIQKHILLYGSTISANEDFWGPLVEELRPRFKQHLEMIWDDAHEQSGFAWFLTTKSGERILVDAMRWLQPAWELARPWFWESVTEGKHFSDLLDHSWKHKFGEIRSDPSALKAFKTLTLKLAAHQVPIAIAVQQQLETSS